VVFNLRRSEPSTAAKPGVFARLLNEPEARCIAPGELGERRFRREAQEAVGGSGVSFLSVAFLWISKEKLPAVGQPPTSRF